MAGNAAWDTRKPWGARERADAPSGPPPVWSGRSILAGAAALFMGALVGAEVGGFAELTAEAPAPADGPGGSLLLLPLLVCFGGPAALWGSLTVVLPVVWVARWASGRLTGRDAWWWVPVVAGVLVSVVVAVIGTVRHVGPGPLTLILLTGAVLLAGAALLARDAALHGGRLLRALGYGALAMVAVFGIGAAAFGAGLFTEYRPPKVDASRLAGDWTDGRGGTLRPAADGTARAEGLTDHEAAYEDDADADLAKYRCTGTGTWSYAPGDSTTWDQRVRLSIEACSFHEPYGLGDPEGWRITGTPEHPELNREYGDLDVPGWYTLTR
ncbi:hypothetical protein [Streptomyces sp. A0958]|uniref:hypothetical protein n=1 Tax=Streptomyces sp. A0958 TaxID=2563101 RepID=UPI001F0D7171|nr:hypothetical protein [Streptomyces sp. A0958]